MRDEITEIEDVPSEQDETADACRKVFLAGCWLIRNGFGRMAILPYAAPSGCHWRCEFHPEGRPDKAFFRYSTGNGSRYLGLHCGGSIRKDSSPKKLAEAIMVSVPEDLRDRCSGEASAETLRWLDQAESAVAAGFIPEAFHEYTEDYSRWVLFRLDGGTNTTIPAPPGYVPPGEELNALSEPFWTAAENRWHALARGGRIALDSEILLDDDFCLSLAERAKRALQDVDAFGSIRVLRATVAAIHSGSKPNADKRGEILMVSSAPSKDPAIRRAGRLLSMVHELHKTGRQRLRVCVGRSHDGSEWRCAIASSDNILDDGWTPRDFSLCAEYPSENGSGFFGWNDSDGKDARALAAMFIERFPDISAAAVGRDWSYAGWFAEMLGRAEHGILPSFYEGIDLSIPEGASLPPPPAGETCPRLESGTGISPISNDDLRFSDLPPPDSDYEALWPFCLTYDGYAGGLRRISDCAAISDAAERKGLKNCSIDELRIAAFFRQRQAKQHDQGPPPGSLVDSIRAAVDELRKGLAADDRR